MNPVSPLPVLVITLAGAASAFVIGRLRGVAPEGGRHAAIDGLRGYLALAVFMHHACIWFFQLRTGRWEAPPSNLYVHLGQTGVALFFMITAFLFVTKVLDADRLPIDWLRLYVGRVMRLLPLYLLAMMLLFTLVAWRSGWTLQQPAERILLAAARWLTFTISGGPDINGVRETYIMVAGVTWSLPYEWFFYLCLPLLALAAGRRPAKASHVAGLLALVMLLVWRPQAMLLFAFLGGVVAAFAVRSPRYCRIARHQAASALVLALLVTVVIAYPVAYRPAPLLLVSLAFCLIAGGNTLFGLLISRTSRVLGEMTYSIYLLHGVLLYTLFEIVLGRELAASLSPRDHWLVVLAVCPLLIGLSHLSLRAVEQPGLAMTVPLTRWLRSWRSTSRTAEA
jgi:peptidoglycan/LPS O-acetylase OafA/YrhL